MKKIHLLKDELINKIAAGEVVESSVSVLKELLENAVDSGASKISIEIEEGGNQKICIKDNGCGMTKEDALLSLKRHATSKVSELQDLFSLKSMGFRGEALASIAAVSKLTLKTCCDDSGLGIELYQEGGQLLKEVPSVKNKGTEISVESLFYNVPARKKFQKSTSFLVSQVHKTVQAMSLCYSYIDIELISKGKKVFQTLTFSDLKSRIAQVLKGNFEREVSFQEGPFSLNGYLGDSKMNRSAQYLFVNERWVFSPFISNSLKDAVATMISEKEFPSFVLHLKTPLDFVDVNVHPQKKEVRFKDKLYLKQKIMQAVQIRIDSPIMIQAPKFERGSFTDFDVFESIPKPSTEEQALFFKEEESLFPYFQIFSKVGSYLFLKENENLWAFDTKAAFFRLLVDLFKKREKKISSQNLLIPYTFDFPKDKMVMIEKKLSLFSQIGIEMRVMGAHTISIDAVPSFLKEKEAAHLFQELFTQFSETEEVDLLFKKYEKKVLSTLSSFAKKRDSAFEEANKLLQEIKNASDPYFCPYGHPILLRITEEKAARVFE